MNSLKSALLISTLMFSYALMAQYQTVPQGFMYQAIARDASGLAIKSSIIKIRISIAEDEANGFTVYEEEHEVTTNKYGLFTLKVGDGNSDDDFKSIDWVNHNYWITTELNSDRGFDLMGTLPILSVPYAIVAQKAIEDEVEDADSNPTNEIQSLSRDGNTVILSMGGGSFTDEVNDADADPNNELQTITRDGNTLTLNKGGGSFTDEVEDDDADPVNEIQTFNRSGNTITLSRGGGSFTDFVNDADADPNNELQSLTWNRDINTLSISRRNQVRISSFTWPIRILNEGSPLSELSQALGGGGYFRTLGPNGQSNFVISSNANATNNHGIAAVFGPDGEQQASMFVGNDNRGSFWCSGAKHFRIEHPLNQDEHIWYASLEGPEAAAYERGSSQLKDGEVFVSYSDHFQLVINPNTVTVQLTSNSADTYGLAVVEKLSTGFIVKELQNGAGNFSFDWEVKGIRKGYEDYEVIRHKDAGAVQVSESESK